MSSVNIPSSPEDEAVAWKIRDGEKLPVAWRLPNGDIYAFIDGYKKIVHKEADASIG